MADLIGRNLGPYRVLAQIGQGGMATVYKAYQPAMDRQVALKVLPPHFMQDPSFVERFEREARTIARLEHPHILPVHDYGQSDDGTTYIVMRYIDAGTLSDRLKRGPMPLPDALRLFEQIADALDYAHEQGVLHRDIKPSNVLVDNRNQPFLTDFGLARMVEGNSNLTGSIILGTPAYMAPELGEGRPANHLTDIYALGVVLYELLTGQPPFEAETPLAVMLKHMTDPLPLPRDVNPNIPPTIEKVVLKSLAKEPEDRFQSVQALLDALQDARADIPIQAITPPETEKRPEPAVKTETETDKPPQPQRRRRLIFGGLGLLLFCCCTFGVLGALNNDNDSTPGGPNQVADAPSDTALLPTVPPEEQAAGVAEFDPGWTWYRNHNVVQVLAIQGNTVWAGTEAGLVRWERQTGDYEIIETAAGYPLLGITTLYAHSDGSLWLAGNGVVRLENGTVTYLNDEGELADQDIHRFFELGPNGFFATAGYDADGIYRFVDNTWQKAEFDLPNRPLSGIQAIAAGQGDILALGLGEDGGLIINNGDTWQRLNPDNNLPFTNIRDLTFGPGDSLWMLDEDSGQIATFDGERFGQAAELMDVVGSTLHYDRAGSQLWLGTAYDGLWRYDGTELVRFGPADGMPETAIMAITQDNDGVLWLGTSNGLLRFDGETFEPWIIEEAGPPFNAAQQIVSGREGEVRFVQLWGGDSLAEFSRTTQDWAEIDMPSSVEAIAQDDNGNWLLGTSEGLWRETPTGEFSLLLEAEALPGLITTLSPTSNDDVWIGTEAGLRVFDLDNSILLDDITGEFPPVPIRSLSIVDDDVVLVGTGSTDENPAALVVTVEGLVDDVIEAGDIFGEDAAAIESITVDSEGRLWVGTWGDGVWRLDMDDADSWRKFGPDEGVSGEVLSLAAGPNGIIWVGTWYNGLYRFEPDAGWTHITPEDGLPGWAVFSLATDESGQLWVGTESGLGRFEMPP